MKYYQLEIELSQLAEIESNLLKKGAIPIKDIIIKQEILKKYIKQ